MKPWLPPAERSGNLVHRDRSRLDAWHAGAGEPALLPDLPIVDAHHHLWQRPGDDYGIAELAAEIRASGHAVQSSVFVECGWHYDPALPEFFRPVGETRQVARAASAAGPTDSGLCAGIVGFADLTAGAQVEAMLQAHIEARRGRFRGARHRAVWDPAIRPGTPGSRPGLVGDPAFRAGFAVLQRLGLSFDAWQYYTQLDEVVDLARAFPEANIIVNHCGGPLGVGPHARPEARVYERWRAGIAALGRCPNVTIKLSGLGMLHCGHDLHYGEAPPSSDALLRGWRPWLEPWLEAFGASRAMFASNFPPDKQSCGYGVMWNAFKRIVAGCSEAERADLFAGTAGRAYRLPVA